MPLGWPRSGLSVCNSTPDAILAATFSCYSKCQRALSPNMQFQPPDVTDTRCREPSGPPPRGPPVALGRPAAWPSGFGPGRGPGPETGAAAARFSGWGGTIVSRATIVLRVGVLLNTFRGAEFFNDLWCEEHTCACWVSEEAAGMATEVG